MFLVDAGGWAAKGGTPISYHRFSRRQSRMISSSLLWVLADDQAQQRCPETPGAVRMDPPFSTPLRASSGCNPRNSNFPRIPPQPAGGLGTSQQSLEQVLPLRWNTIIRLIISSKADQLLGHLGNVSPSETHPAIRKTGVCHLKHG